MVIWQSTKIARVINSILKHPPIYAILLASKASLRLCEFAIHTYARLFKGKINAEVFMPFKNIDSGQDKRSYEIKDIKNSCIKHYTSLLSIVIF